MNKNPDQLELFTCDFDFKEAEKYLKSVTEKKKLYKKDPKNITISKKYIFNLREVLQDE